MNKLKLLEEWQQVMQESEAVLAALEKVVGSYDGPIRHCIYTMQSRYTDALSIAIQDNAVGVSSTWLQWYAFENEFGAKALMASPNSKNKPKKIRALKQLLALIEASA